LVGMAKSLGHLASPMPLGLPEITPLPHLRTGPKSAPVAVSRTFSEWLCVGHGVASGVSLWGTLGVASGRAQFSNNK